jgi:hypothetical protein
MDFSFSDFGDADTVILINAEGRKISVFKEAKVKTCQRTTWSAAEEFQRFMRGTEEQVESSNLFAQLAHKGAMVRELRTGSLDTLRSGVTFPACSRKQARKIGTNAVVLRGLARVQEYLDETFYVAILPDTSDRLTSLFPMIANAPTANPYGYLDVDHLGYLRWEDIRTFCEHSELNHTIAMLDFNRGQIY